MADYLTFEQTSDRARPLLATNQLLNRIYAGERLTELLAQSWAYSRMREFSDLTTQSPRAADGLDFDPKAIGRRTHDGLCARGRSAVQQGSKMLASRRQLTRCRNSNYTSNPPMARGPSSDEKKPEPPPCPKCGKPLVYHASRMELDGKGNPETVHMFLCYAHGFFTFRDSKGLTAGF